MLVLSSINSVMAFMGAKFRRKFVCWADIDALFLLKRLVVVLFMHQNRACSKKGQGLSYKEDDEKADEKADDEAYVTNQTKAQIRIQRELKERLEEHPMESENNPQKLAPYG